MTAAEARDTTTLGECIYPGSQVTVTDITPLVSADLLVDDAEVDVLFASDPGRSVVARIPYPDQPRDTTIISGGSIVQGGPPHQGGVNVTLTSEKDGRWYVTALAGYTSG